MNFGFLILLALVVIVAAIVVPLVLKQIAGNCTRSLPLGSPFGPPSALRLVPPPRDSAVPVAAAALPYRKKDYLLTAAERSFCHGHDTVSSRATSVALGFSVLCGVVEGQLLVFAKVRLADLVYMPKGTANRQTQLL